MRVIFDISPIGFGLNVPLYRSGIFRYVRQIAHGLAASNEVELTLSAGLTGSYGWGRYFNLDASLTYCESDEILKKVRFPHNPIGRSLARRLWDTGRRGIKPLVNILNSPGAQNMVESHLHSLWQKSARQSDIFHSPSFALPELTTSIKGLRRFLTVHDLLPVLYPHFFDPATPPVFKAILGSLRPTDWVVCDSENTKNDLSEYLPELDRSRIFVAHLAADPALFYQCTDEEKQREAKRRYNIPEGPYVLSVCSIDKRKNLEHIVRCFTDLVRQEKMKDLNLVLVGPIAKKSQELFNQIIHSGEARSRIVLTGFVRDEDLAAIYSGALMFVYPTLYEGFGLPPLEAMQCGVPVITSKNSSLPEVVGNAGVLVDPDDAAQLCSNMHKIYESPSLQAALSASSLAQSDEFSWQRCLSQTMHAYKTALAD